MRVVVTGLGCVTPLGMSSTELWASLLAKKVASCNLLNNANWKHLHEALQALPSQVFAPIDSIPHSENVHNRTKHPRAFQFAELAAFEALNHAKLSSNKNIGVFVGWGMPGVEEVYSVSDRLSNHKRVSPYLIPAILGNSPASFISRRFGLQGPLGAPSLACATGSYAIGEAFRFLSDPRNGGCDIIVAGATEAPINIPSIVGFLRAGALATGFNDLPTKASRPFCQQRNGFVMGEGAGIMVLERLESALKRGADILAEIVGFSSISDAHHPTSPDPDGSGAKRAITECLNGYRGPLIVNAHATSTKIGDEIELQVFNDLPNECLITANKGNFGHLLGAGSAVESIISVMTLQKRIIPPIVTSTNLLMTRKTICTESVQLPSGKLHLLKTAFGFGGVNVALAFKSSPPVGDQG